MPSKKIHTFLHCAKCVSSLPFGENPQSYARLSVGATAIGIQIWCLRHDESVAEFELAHPVPVQCQWCADGTPHVH